MKLLEEVNAYGNPIHERIVGENFTPEPNQSMTLLEKEYHKEFYARVPHLKKLDGRVFLDRDDEIDEDND